jgi:hypothetical protein
LVVLVWAKLGRHFCLRGLCRSRSVVTRLVRAARAALSAASARAAGEVVAVIALWVMDRVASRRAVVKEIWSVLTPVVVWVAAWALRRTSWVAASQVQISWRTSMGVVGRRLGPRVGPASVIVDLFSPMVVSDAL